MPMVNTWSAHRSRTSCQIRVRVWASLASPHSVLSCIGRSTDSRSGFSPICPLVCAHQPPGRPLELFGVHGGEFCRAHRFVQERVFQAAPDRHLGGTRLDAIVEDLALHGLDEQPDTDRVPVVAHQFQDVDLLTLLAGRLHDDLHGAAVRQQPPAISVALVEAQIVEHRVRELGIVLGPLRPVFVPVERRLAQHRVVAGLGQPVEDGIVDVLAVDRHRQRAAEIGVAEELAPDRILDVEVGIERQARTLGRRPAAHLDAAALLPPASGRCSWRSRDRRPAGRIRRLPSWPPRDSELVIVSATSSM